MKGQIREGKSIERTGKTGNINLKDRKDRTYIKKGQVKCRGLVEKRTGKAWHNKERGEVMQEKGQTRTKNNK